jgi:hypothetical protein
MALVRGRYYQHSIRIHKRVTTEYYGVGPAGAGWEATDELVRQAREHRRIAARELAAGQRRLYDAERDRGEGLRRITTAILEGLGYWRPQCRVWRRRMGAARALPAPQRGDTAVRAEMRDLIGRVAAGPDAAALERLALLVRQYPRAAGRAIGCDLMRLARESLAAIVFDRPSDRAERDAMVARLELRARELAGPDPTPEVLACATTTAYEETGYHLLLATSTATREAFRAEHPRFTMRCVAALRRYLYSMKTLVEIKQRQRPVVLARIHVADALPSP